MAEAKVHTKSGKSAAEAVRFARTEAKHATRLVMRVDTVGAPRFERHHFSVERLRAVHGRDTSARQCVQRIEGIRARVTRTRVVGVLHLLHSGRQPAY
jgi:hypothetical protein